MEPLPMTPPPLTLHPYEFALRSSSLRPTDRYTMIVPLRRTCSQLGVFALLYIVKSVKAIAIVFPLIIGACIPIRRWLLPKVCNGHMEPHPMEPHSHVDPPWSAPSHPRPFGGRCCQRSLKRAIWCCSTATTARSKSSHATSLATRR